MPYKLTIAVTSLPLRLKFRISLKSRGFNFRVNRFLRFCRTGEEERYKAWSGNANRVLLWHGSRLTNWVGILSQGLRIAPPEAPKTGYRFGKGIYFADII